MKLRKEGWARESCRPPESEGPWVILALAFMQIRELCIVWVRRSGSGREQKGK